MSDKCALALRALILFSLVFALGACASTPYTGRSQLILMSESDEIQQGLQFSNQVIAESKIETGTKRAQRVEKIGKDLAAVADKKDYDWIFKVIVSEEVNAFCISGGKVFVYTGILDVVGDNDDELAAIMGHEIAHALARHGAERSSQSGLTQVGLATAQVAVAATTKSAAAGELTAAGGSVAAQLGLLLPYSRLHESEADHIGIILAAKAGYDPRGAISLWEKMAKLNEGKEPLALTSTHPLNKKRIEDLEKLMPEALKYYNSR